MASYLECRFLHGARVLMMLTYSVTRSTWNRICCAFHRYNTDASILMISVLCPLSPENATLMVSP